VDSRRGAIAHVREQVMFNDRSKVIVTPLDAAGFGIPYPYDTPAADDEGYGVAIWGFALGGLPNDEVVVGVSAALPLFDLFRFHGTAPSAVSVTEVDWEAIAEPLVVLENGDVIALRDGAVRRFLPDGSYVPLTVPLSDGDIHHDSRFETEASTVFVVDDGSRLVHVSW